MSLVRLQDLTLQYGPTTILDQLTLAINENNKIGLIGDNGTGKSTLLKILSQELTPTLGSLSFLPQVRLGYLSQELLVPQDRSIYDEILTAFDEVRQLEPQLREIEEQLAQTTLSEIQREKLAHRYEALQERYQIQGGYEIQERVETVLTRLNLERSAWTQSVKSFSGGEQNLIGLAKIMVRHPNLYLFDEPSNHLDMQGIEWFTRFLKNEISTFVLVSHNRYLLDECTNMIWVLHQGKIKTYKGNYSAYRQKKEEDDALQERLYKTQQNEIERLQFQARRLKDMANAYDDPGQAKRAKALERRIERMDVVEKPDDSKRKIGFHLNSSKRHGLIALAVKDFSLSFGERSLLKNVSFQLHYQDRVCLTGPNGSGKTTLFKKIIEEGSWEHPTLRLGKSVKLGYYSQMHDTLDPQKSIVENVSELGGIPLGAARPILFRFLFKLEDLERRVETLSGGEKSRVQLAGILAQGVNLLFLDEPTNHLDISSCEIIEEVLQAFDGTLFIISHDRYFLKKMVNRVLAIEETGQIKDYPYTFDEYWQNFLKDQERRRLELPSQPKSRKKGALSQDSRRELQKELRRMSNKIQNLEKQIEQSEKEKLFLNQEIENAYSQQNFPEGSRLTSKLKTLETQIETQYQEWESLQVQLEKSEEPD
jgi:ATP-binding cassette subfamily F protein 3